MLYDIEKVAKILPLLSMCCVALFSGEHTHKSLLISLEVSRIRKFSLLWVYFGSYRHQGLRYRSDWSQSNTCYSIELIQAIRFEIELTVQLGLFLNFFFSFARKVQSRNSFKFLCDTRLIACSTRFLVYYVATSLVTPGFPYVKNLAGGRIY